MAALIAQLWAVDGGTQPAVRRATNIASLLNYPAFYQLRPIVVVGTLKTLDSGRLELTDEATTLPVSFKGSAPDGLSEVRGELWDLGRMNPDDPRLSGMDIRTVFGIDPEGAWPRAGQVMAIMANAIAPAAQPSVPTVRSMVLFPARYRDQPVTVVGQFAGRNLLGDLPDAPARSRYDFVVKTADAAIWVTGIRPRGKDFELALDARIDTGRWLEVTGRLQQGRGLQWLDGEEGGTLKLAKAPLEQTEAAPVRVPAAPPPEVVFSAPTDGESDVPLGSSVRIQFSRDLGAATLKNRVGVEYVNDNGAVPIPDFTTEYRAAPRVLEIKFAKPLEPFRRVRVTFADGVLGVDQQPLAPWTLTFELGGT